MQYLLNFYQKNKSLNVETSVNLEEKYHQNQGNLEKLIQETND